MINSTNHGGIADASKPPESSNKLPWANNPPSKAKLCERCQNIDIQTLLNKKYLRVGSVFDGVFLLELGKLSIGSLCPLCRLFASFQDSDERNVREDYHLRLFPDITQLGEQIAKGKGPKVGLTVAFGDRFRTLSTWERRYFMDQGFILPVRQGIEPSTSHSVCTGFNIIAESISYVRIHEWLNRCQLSHSNTCGAKGVSLPFKLSCIDCFSREICRVDVGDEYFCLSYVWGTSNTDTEAAREGSRRRLPSKGVPQVIEDAMKVVSDLGKKYLWVDRYCIDQQDHDSKDVQIQNMDRIYEGAHATIVASAGLTANSGLPGVGHTARKRQPSAVVGDQVFVSSLAPLECALEESPWMGRAWTYQEAVCSRRCLFFTKLQVYFVCRSMTCSETQFQERGSRVKSDSMLRADIFGLSRSGTVKPSSQLRELADHITEYSGRNLTYQEDALNAFRGLLARSPFPSYYGVPIAPTDSPKWVTSRKDRDVGFARGLYWTQHHGGVPRAPASLSRRPGFPSWSWTGWKGAVGYCPKFGPKTQGGEEELMQFDGKYFDMQVFLEDSDGRLAQLDRVSIPGMGRPRAIVELSNYLLIDAWILQFRFQFGMSFCGCQPTSQHEGPTQNLPGSVIWNEEAEDLDVLEKRKTRPWDCIWLFDSKGYGGKNDNLHNLMVIERVGDTAYRVGTVTIMERHDTFQRLPKKKQRIRLG